MAKVEKESPGTARPHGTVQGKVFGFVELAPFATPGNASSRASISLQSTRRAPGTSTALVRTWQPSDFVDCHSDVMCCRYSPDGQLIAAGCANGNVMLIHAETGDCLHTLTDHDTKKIKMPVTAVVFPPTNTKKKTEEAKHVTTAHANGLIKNWNLPSRTAHKAGDKYIATTVDEARPTLNITYSPFYTNQLLTCGSDPSLHLYDMNTSQRISSMNSSTIRGQTVMDGHQARVFAIKYHPGQAHIFCSGGWDDTVQFWDDRQPHSLMSLYGPHICGDGIDIDKKNNQVITASWRKTNALQIWDFRTAKLITVVPRDTANDVMPYCVQWFDRDFILTAGCDGNMVRFTERNHFETLGCLGNMPSGVYCMDHFGIYVIAGSGSLIWRIKKFI